MKNLNPGPLQEANAEEENITEEEVRSRLQELENCYDADNDSFNGNNSEDYEVMKKMAVIEH